MSTEKVEADSVDSSTVGFLYAAGINAAIGTVLLITFCVLRTKVPDVFQLRYLLNTWKSHNDHNGNRVGVTEPRPTSSFFGWVGPVFHTTEEEVVNKIGLDAAMFFRFIRTSFLICSCLAIFGIVVLMPTYGTGGNNNLPIEELTPPIAGLRVISLANVPPKNGRFWATCIAEFFAAAVVVYFLAMDFDHYARLRRKYRVSETPVNYSVIIFDIPENDRNEKAIRDRFETIVPGQIAQVMLVRNSKAACKLQGKLDAAVMKRELAEHVCSVKGEDQAFRPGVCGCCMCWAPKVETQSYWAREQDRLADEIHDQGSLAAPTPSAIMVLTNKRATSLLVQANSSISAMSWHVERAAEPAALHWPAFSVPGYQAEIRTILVAIFMVGFTLFWTIPAAFIVGLFNLRGLAERDAFDWLNPLLDLSPAVTGLVEGLLPPVVMAVIVSLIPPIFRAVLGNERIAAKNTIEMKTRDYFYMFSLYGSFLVIVLGSTFFRDVQGILDDPAQVIDALANEVPGVGVFFSSFILIKCLVPFPLLLSGVVRVIVRWIMLKLAKTERQIRKARSGGSLFQYFRHSGSGMLILFLCIMYSSLSPLVCVCSVIFFALAYVAFRYALLFTTYAEFDAGGDLFPGTFWGTMIGLMLKQLIVIATLGLKKAPGPAAVTVIPLIATACFTYVISKRFQRISKEGSLYDLYDEASSLKSDEVPAQYKNVYEQPAGRVTNYENLNGLVDIRDVYSEVESEDPDNMDAVHSETLDNSVGYVPDPAAAREEV